MSAVSSLICTFPCSNTGKQPPVSAALRITGIILGVIAIVVGVLALIRISQLYFLGTTGGSLCVAGGSLLLLAGLSLRCRGKNGEALFPGGIQTKGLRKKLSVMTIKEVNSVIPRLSVEQLEKIPLKHLQDPNLDLSGLDGERLNSGWLTSEVLGQMKVEALNKILPNMEYNALRVMSIKDKFGNKNLAIETIPIERLKFIFKDVIGFFGEGKTRFNLAHPDHQAYILRTLGLQRSFFA